MGRHLRAIIGFVVLLGVSDAGAETPPPVRPAIDGILDAFRTHPLVGLGDAHELAQEEDFYAALVRDPRFAHEVGNVVVEFGGAAHQDVIDRYLDGGDVPYAELRKVWSDVVGWMPTVTRLGYMNFFAQVRAVNQSLQPDQRIHVWLGEPPIDWARVKTREDWLPILRTRDSHAANVITREILAKSRKALVIYGTLHFYPGDGPLKQLKDLIEQDYPHAFFVVTPYVGFQEKACSVDFEKSMRNWPIPALAAPVRGSGLEHRLRASGCHFTPIGEFTPTPGMTAAQRAHAAAIVEDEWSGAAGDALLYMGPAARLTRAPMLPDLYLDPAYRAEISRRRQIIAGQPLTGFTVDANPAVPYPFRP